MFRTWDRGCCKPYDLRNSPGSVEEYLVPEHDLYNFKMEDVLVGPIAPTYDNNKTWSIKNIESIVNTFELHKLSDRETLFSDFLIAIANREL